MWAVWGVGGCGAEGTGDGVRGRLCIYVCSGGRAYTQHRRRFGSSFEISRFEKLVRDWCITASTWALCLAVLRAKLNQITKRYDEAGSWRVLISLATQNIFAWNPKDVLLRCSDQSWRSQNLAYMVEATNITHINEAGVAGTLKT